MRDHILSFLDNYMMGFWSSEDTTSGTWDFSVPVPPALIMESADWLSCSGRALLVIQEPLWGGRQFDIHAETKKNRQLPNLYAAVWTEQSLCLYRPFTYL